MSLYLGNTKIHGVRTVSEYILDPSIPSVLFSEDENNRSLCIGANYSEDSGISNGLLGSMAVARLYSSALTNEQVDYLYNFTNPSNCAAMIGDSSYDTLSEALLAANEGDTVTVMAGNHGVQTIEGVCKNITIFGNTGAILVGIVFNDDIENITIKNISFRGAPRNAFIWIKKASNRLKVLDCSFVGTSFGTWSSNPEALVSNTEICNCVFNLRGSFTKTSGATAVYLQYVNNLTVIDNLFLRVPFNGIQVSQVATGNIIIGNNTFIETGSRNINLQAIKDDYTGQLIIQGNSYVLPTIPRNYSEIEEENEGGGNYVCLGLEESYYPIVDLPDDISNYDHMYYYNLGTIGVEGNDAFGYAPIIRPTGYVPDPAPTPDINSLIVNLGLSKDYELIDTISNVSLESINKDAILKTDSCDFSIYLNTDNAYIFNNIKDQYGSLAQSLSVETFLEISSLDNVVYPLGSLSDDRGFGFSVDSRGVPSFQVYLGGLDYTTATSSNALQLNKYYHLVGTYDGKYVRIYVDGVMVGETMVFDETSMTNEFIKSLPKYNGEVV